MRREAWINFARWQIAKDEHLRLKREKREAAMADRMKRRMRRYDEFFPPEADMGAMNQFNLFDEEQERMFESGQQDE
jgi:hypothetical protein